MSGWGGAGVEGGPIHGAPLRVFVVSGWGGAGLEGGPLHGAPLRLLRQGDQDQGLCSGNMTLILA